MGKVDKTFYWRMEGMHHAYHLVKEGGIEALKNDIKKRGMLKCQFNVTTKEMQNMHHEMSLNVYNNMMTCTLWVLWNVFGFGKQRLQRFKDAYDQKVQQAMDLDWLGEHYSYIYEWGEELQRQHGITLDINRIKENQLELDQKNNYTGRCKLSVVLGVLEENGYHDAANLLRSKIYVRD